MNKMHYVHEVHYFVQFIYFQKPNILLNFLNETITFLLQIPYMNAIYFDHISPLICPSNSSQDPSSSLYPKFFMLFFKNHYF